MNPTGMMMVTVQVRDFNAATRWYQEVLGLTVLWMEPGEFCMLVPPGLQDLPWHWRQITRSVFPLPLGAAGPPHLLWTTLMPPLLNCGTAQ